MELKALILLLHYKKDFEKIRLIFKSIGLEVQEIDNKIVIIDSLGNILSYLEIEKFNDEYLVTTHFIYNGNTINYRARLGDYAKHISTKITIEDTYYETSIEIDNPNFSRFIISTKNKNKYGESRILINDESMNASRMLNNNNESCNILLPNSIIRDYSWVLPFNISQRNRNTKNNFQISFQYYSDQIDNYEIFIEIEKDGLEQKLKFIIPSLSIFNYLVNQAISSEITKKFLNRIVKDFRGSVKTLKKLLENLIPDVNPVMKLVASNSNMTQYYIDLIEKGMIEPNSIIIPPSLIEGYNPDEEINLTSFNNLVFLKRLDNMSREEVAKNYSGSIIEATLKQENQSNKNNSTLEVEKRIFFNILTGEKFSIEEKNDQKIYTITNKIGVYTIIQDYISNKITTLFNGINIDQYILFDALNDQRVPAVDPIFNTWDIVIAIAYGNAIFSNERLTYQNGEYIDNIFNHRLTVFKTSYEAYTSIHSIIVYIDNIVYKYYLDTVKGEARYLIDDTEINEQEFIKCFNGKTVPGKITEQKQPIPRES